MIRSLLKRLIELPLPVRAILILALLPLFIPTFLIFFLVGSTIELIKDYTED